MCAVICHGVVLLSLVSVLVASDETAPLAQCRLQSILVAEQPEMENIQVVMAAQRPANIISANYRRDPSGDWNVPGEISGDNPDIRLLLMTPNGPLLILLSINVDGESFRMTRERWIDDALQGRNSTEEQVATDKTVDQTADESGTDDEESKEADGISPQRFRPAEALTRLQKYAAQPGIEVGREEARWLLAQWSPGPTLLELRPNYAMDRSRSASLWAALDKNSDAELSAEEVSSAMTRLQALDDNEDDWVDEPELTESPLITSWTAFPVATVLNEATDWGRLTRLLRTTYTDAESEQQPLTETLLTGLGLSGLSQLTPQHLSQLNAAEPHLTLRVELGTQDSQETGLYVTGLAEDVTTQFQSVSGVEDVVSLRLPQCHVELSAAQPSHDAKWNGQVSIGAVIDGSPLLRSVDLDNDRRLSLREIETVPALLAALDQDADGAVKLDEVPVPIRLVVTLGPHAHSVLSRPSVAPRQTSPVDSPAAPPWFASMDLNSDGDLTPAEFLGTRAQFDELDLDQNQRVSTREAAKSAE